MLELHFAGLLEQDVEHCSFRRGEQYVIDEVSFTPTAVTTDQFHAGALRPTLKIRVFAVLTT